MMKMTPSKNVCKETAGRVARITAMICLLIPMMRKDANAQYYIDHDKIEQTLAAGRKSISINHDTSGRGKVYLESFSFSTAPSHVKIGFDKKRYLSDETISITFKKEKADSADKFLGDQLFITAVAGSEISGDIVPDYQSYRQVLKLKEGEEKTIRIKYDKKINNNFRRNIKIESGFGSYGEARSYTLWFDDLVAEYKVKEAQEWKELQLRHPGIIRRNKTPRPVGSVPSGYDTSHSRIDR